MQDRVMEQEQIRALLTGELVGLIYFYTPMCGTCQMAEKMLLVIEQLIPEIPLLKVNLNFHPHLAETFAIESVPCLLIIKNGDLKEKIYAFHSVPYLFGKIRGEL